MSAKDGSAARSLSTEPAEKRTESPWRQPVGTETESPARALQQRLRVALENEAVLRELPLWERAIRVLSRAAGYVLPAAVIAFLAWLIL